MSTRVLIVIKGLGPGGAERLVVDQLRHGGEGIEYELFVCTERKPNLLGEVEALGIPTHLGYESRFWPRVLRTVLKERRFDVVHSHLPIAASGARLVAQTIRPKPRLIYTEHNRWPSYLWPTRLANWATIGFDDVDIAVSADAAATMKWPAAKVEVITHGVDHSSLPTDVDACRAALRAELGLPADALIIGTVANLRREKAQHLLLDAFAAAKISDATLMIVGQGPLEQELKAQAAALGLGERVRFAGYRSDATNVMAGFDLFALPSAHEGRPVALMEAVSIGLPVLVSDAGGMPQMLAGVDRSMVVQAGDTAGLSAAMLVACQELSEQPRNPSQRPDNFAGGAAFDQISHLYRSDGFKGQG